MSETTLLEAALSYAKFGWRVFPCRPSTKTPLTSHGVKDATTDEETIKTWWTRWPTANIAMACGSGVHAVDIDFDEEKGVDGWASIKEFQSLPETVCQKSPRGGAHFLFKSDDLIRNMNCFRSGIDIRSEGFYLMLAPSVHPNGKVYAWLEGHAPGEIALAEFPEYMKPPTKKSMPWESRAVVTRTPVQPSQLTERASLYLQECEAATQGQDGHSKLLWAASALVNGFDMSDGDALSMLWREFNPRCNPPWDSQNPADVKDFERKVSEARKTCQKPRGWLLDEYNLRDDTRALEYGQRLAEGLLSIKFTTPEILVRTATAKATTRAGDWPSELLSPCGYVGDLVKWINATAMYQQPKLAVLCSLVSAGALFGNKVREPSNQRTNLYAMGVAPSSAGKDHPFKRIAALFDEAGASNLIGGNSVTSDSAIEVALVNHPTQLFPIDEAGDFLTGIKSSANGGGSHYLGTIKPALKILWSSAQGIYKGKQRADDVAREIHEPCVSIWATTTPTRLYEGLGQGDLEDGFVARMIVGVVTTRPDYVGQVYVDPPSDLVAVTNAWVTRKMPDGTGGDIQSLRKGRIVSVPMQPRADQLFNEFARECGRLLADGDENSDKTASLWGKCVENAKRVALILASGENFDTPHINESHAVYACNLVRQSASEMIESINIHMSENSFEADKKRILRIIKQAGQRGISKRDLTRKTQFLRDRRTRDNYISELEEGSQIVTGKGKGTDGAWIWVFPYGLNTEVAK